MARSAHSPHHESTMSETPQTIRLADYRPPAYTLDHIDLHFNLDPETTRVTSRLSVRRLREIGRASGRERVSPPVYSAGVAVSLNKTTSHKL